MPAKVSIIVPVYNAEKTLMACLGNLVNQTLKDIELILVNDGSIDNSLSILMECERIFPEKTLVVNKMENSGPGGARNAGLCYASGEYIGFVDSDDLVDITMFEKLYNCAVLGNYDMVDCGYFHEKTNTQILITGDECVGTLDAQKRAILISNGGWLCTRIFRRELFDNFKFRENTILEDMETLMLMFIRSKRIGTVKETLYKYCNTPGSASAEASPKRYQMAIVGAMKAIGTTVIPLENYEAVQLAVEYSLAYLYKCGIVNALASESKIGTIQQREYLKELYHLRSQYIRIPLESNSFIQNKISRENRKIIRTVDSMGLDK